MSIEKALWTRNADDVLAELGSSHHGLSQEEAERRLSIFGPNEIAEARRANAAAILLYQFKSPLIYILLASVVLTAGLREFTDTAIIGAILALNAVIGFVQEYRAERALEALRELTVPRAGVLRGGRDREIDSREIVSGDILLLQSGDRIPADGRLLRVSGFQVDESLLTGESTVVDKAVDALPDPDLPLADRANMVHMGAVTSRGRAHAVVTATGMATELGRIAGEVRETTAPASPLKRRMDRFARLLGTAIVVACLVVFPLGVGLGESMSTMLRIVVALIVAAIPEGLPVVLTITLAIGVGRMARRRAVVRTLPSVETLGSCTTIASDKTGTLTENRMTVQAIYTAEELYQVTGTGYELEGRITLNGQDADVGDKSPLYWTLLAGVLNNEASVYRSDSDADVRGDPTEIALLVAGAKARIWKGDAEETYPPIAGVPFEPERGYSATRHSGLRDGSQVTFVKGALERVLDMCVDAQGRGRHLPLDRGALTAAADRLGMEGLRVLGLAYAIFPSGGALDIEAQLEGLTFLGLVGMLDPPRPEVPSAVAACRDAGIRVLMLTGDHRSTATAIAQRVGIHVNQGVVEGRHIEELNDAELDDAVSDGASFARVEPHHKLRIVQALQRQGEIVAVTGDGVNDAPALRAADLGVAMGQRGTDVAREASDLVIADDNFATIVAAVEEGRIIFDNIRNVTFFLLSTGITVVIAVFVSILGGFPLPLLPAQIIWVNLVTNGIQDMALAFEPGEKNVLRRPPRPIDEGIVSRVLWERTALVSVVIAAATLGFFLVEYYVADSSLEHARTTALTTIVLFQALHVGNARSERLSVFQKSPVSNPFLFVGTIVALSVHAGALYWAPTQHLLEVEPLDLLEWIRIGASAVSIVAVVELHKLYCLVRDRRRASLLLRPD